MKEAKREHCDSGDRIVDAAWFVRRWWVVVVVASSSRALREEKDRDGCCVLRRQRCLRAVTPPSHPRHQSRSVRTTRWSA